MGYFGENQILAHDGRLYMLDMQLSHILVYTDDGEYVTTLLGPGEGPGELRNPGRLFLVSDDRLAVQHSYPTRLAFADLDGTPFGEWRLGANAYMSVIQETTDGWFGIYSEARIDEGSGNLDTVLRVTLLDDEGERTADYYEKADVIDRSGSSVVDEAEEHEPWYSAKPVGDGLVVLAAARDEYRLEWRNLEGETVRTLVRDVEAHERTEDELARLKYGNYSISGDKIVFDERRLCSRDAVIRTLVPQPDGSLHVRTSRFVKDLPDGMVCRYDVHGPDGTLIERVEIHDPSGSFDHDYDTIALVDDGRAMVLRNRVSAMRAHRDARMHPEVRKKLPPIPDEREDVVFTPIMYDLVPYARDE